jgi:DEAD/DEAH box helicase domain-containing protein
VVATSALELGIDIGSLDVVIIHGFPWNRAALWQQAGRAGRRKQASLAIMVADAHPLDQHYTRHPEALFALKAPSAHADWLAESILGQQLQCAAYERVLNLAEDQRWFGDTMSAIANKHLQPLDGGQVNRKSTL